MKIRKYAGRLTASFLLVLLGGLLMVGAYCCKAPGDDASYLYLVRHGRTYSNEQGLLVGRYGNYDLTEEAVGQAREVGRALQDVTFDQAYSSTLPRANDTAHYLLEGAGQTRLPVQKRADLDDISWGDAEGFTQQGFMEEYHLSEFPDAFGSANDPSFVSPIHAETMYQFTERFDRGIRQILTEIQPGSHVLVVAHSSMQFWLEQQFPELEGKGIDNLGVTILKITGDRMEVVEYNQVMYEQ